MIITRTPYRISFFGGGSDFPEHYRECGGRVIAAAINKYCYISLRKLPPFFAHHDRIVWSEVENVRSCEEIHHPAVRAVLKEYRLPFGVSMTHDGDIPARSGIGSSSAFTVGLLHAVETILGHEPSQRELADRAIELERDRIGETVGCQDQITSAFGGFNVIEFLRGGGYNVLPLNLKKERLALLTKHLLLVFSGVSRISSEVAKEQFSRIDRNRDALNELAAMAAEAGEVLAGDGDLEDFGRMLDDSWRIKRSLSDRISNDHLDGMYAAARNAGALGGKVLGAGSGGFLLFFVPPERHGRVIEALRCRISIPVEFDFRGSIVAYNDYGEI